jgi:hypothetical protein
LRFGKKYAVFVDMSTATATASATSLRELLRQDAGRDMIATFLNGLSPAERVEESLSPRGSEVAKLYRAVAGGTTVAVADFVPKNAPATETIIFEGRNSLPAFSRFQKRFARLKSSQVVGYNHQMWGFATGPGFFVLKPASDDADVPGELYFDYTTEPDAVPDGWPAFKANDRGLSNLVYATMKDYMRKVATDVYVGEAYKRGKSEKQFFILCHE